MTSNQIIMEGSSSMNCPISECEESSLNSIKEQELCTKYFEKWSQIEQKNFVEMLLKKMFLPQQSEISAVLVQMLQRDFISLLTKMGLDHVVENILSYLDAKSLSAAELVCKEWCQAISEAMSWKKLIESRVQNDTLWKNLIKKRGWNKFLSSFLTEEPDPTFYRRLYPKIIQDINDIESNWKYGSNSLKLVNIDSEDNQGVYCIQYDEDKIVGGSCDKTIKIWDCHTLQLSRILKGHRRAITCLQYNEHVLISGSNDRTVRVWDVTTGKLIKILRHHTGAILNLRFKNDLIVTASSDKSIGVWKVTSPSDITLQKTLFGHKNAVKDVDFDDKYIVSASSDETIKVWNISTGEVVYNLIDHKNDVLCLQYKDGLIVSGSSDETIKIWDITTGECLRTLKGHIDKVTCLQFDSKIIVSGDYFGVIRVWDLKAALNPRAHPGSLCLRSLRKHRGKVFRLQFDEFQIVSSSIDETIQIWKFLNDTPPDIPDFLLRSSSKN